MSSIIVESQVRVPLLDIEGTTTPVDFVYKTLFPYARRKLESFVLEHFREAEIASMIRQLHMQHNADDSQGLQPPSWIDEQVESRLRSCIEFSKWLMVKDSKATPLKSLQGKIWEVGYDKGEPQECKRYFAIGTRMLPSPVKQISSSTALTAIRGPCRAARSEERMFRSTAGQPG